MIHFGVKELSYSVKFDEKEYCYGEAKYKKLFAVSFLNTLVRIEFKPSETKINAFDLFCIERQGGYKTNNHFATVHAGRDYVLDLKFSRKRKNLSINVIENNYKKWYYNNGFSFPALPVGFITQKTHNNIQLEKVATDEE